jgi:hypothetical protein
MAGRSGIDTQVGIAEETTYGTLVAPARFLEFTAESLKAAIDRNESKGKRAAQRVIRSDHWKAGKRQGGGGLEFEIGNKGFGLLLTKHLLGSVTTTADGAGKKHSGSVADLFGKSLTVQIGRPDVSGVVQPFSYLGCKIDEWEISNNVDGFATLKLSKVDARDEDSTTGLTSATAPSGGRDPALVRGRDHARRFGVRRLRLLGQRLEQAQERPLLHEGEQPQEGADREGDARLHRLVQRRLRRPHRLSAVPERDARRDHRDLDGRVDVRRREAVQARDHDPVRPLRRRDAKQRRRGHAASSRCRSRRTTPAPARSRSTTTPRTQRRNLQTEVKLEGLGALQRELKRTESELGAELAAELKEAGKIVEDEAHVLIREQRLVGGERSSGRLDRLTRTAVRSRGVVVVRSAANRQGFPYPRLWEFARGRAFLNPALDRKRDAVLARVERMLDRLADRFNR